MGFSGMMNLMVILIVMSDSRWLTGGHVFVRNASFFPHQTIVARVFFSVLNMGFWGMTNPMPVCLFVADDVR